MYQLAVEQAPIGLDREELSINRQGFYSSEFEGFQLNTAYQPIVHVDLRANTDVFGYEGLVRCRKDRNFTAPPQFFSSVKNSDRCYVECLCQEMHIKNWQPWSDNSGSLFVNLDVCLLDAKRLNSKAVALAISKAQLWGVDPERLVCEVIESKAPSLRALKYLADCLKDFGVRIAVDDFGVDYSNIDRVRLLKPDYVKLDGLFFHRFATNGRLLPMLQGLIQRFQEQGAEVIVEAIETEHHRDTALDCNISLMQGYYFGRPELLM